MVILETKEQLVKQIHDTWEIIMQADVALERSLEALKEAHTNLRRFSRRYNHDQAGVGAGARVESTTRTHTRATTEAKFVSGLSAARAKQMVRARRNTSEGVSTDTNAESGC